MPDAAPAHRDGIAPEDQARGDFYALLARLFAKAPDSGLLASLANAAPLVVDANATPLPVDADPANADAHSNGLAEAWSGLCAASAAADPAAVGEEFLALFIGVGRSEVSPYASHYLGPQSGRPLAEIRAGLAALGLARLPENSEFEDHLAVVLEGMRMLVTGDDERPPTEISLQRSFFDQHLISWAFDCCTAIEESPVANYYRSVAQFARTFLALERDSLAMD